MENRMTTDLLEAKQRGSERALIEQVEEYQQEVLKERCIICIFLRNLFFSILRQMHST